MRAFHRLAGHRSAVARTAVRRNRAAVAAALTGRRAARSSRACWRCLDAARSARASRHGPLPPLPPPPPFRRRRAAAGRSRRRRGLGRGAAGRDVRRGDEPDEGLEGLEEEPPPPATARRRRPNRRHPRRPSARPFRPPPLGRSNALRPSRLRRRPAGPAPMPLAPVSATAVARAMAANSCLMTALPFTRRHTTQHVRATDLPPGMSEFLRFRIYSCPGPSDCHIRSPIRPATRTADRPATSASPAAPRCCPPAIR